jgi:crossover junction endodeoxyribonuclease RusA
MAETLTIKLPWPPADLSPNARHGHWGSRQRAVKAYRHACRLATLEATRCQPARAEPLVAVLLFHPPGGMQHDRDNLQGRMKAGLDGVADALQINDRLLVEVRSRVGDPAGSIRDAGVELTLIPDSLSSAALCPGCGRPR